MGASAIIYRGIEKTLGSGELTFEDKINRISELFSRAAADLPADMVDDIYSYYLDESRFAPVDNEEKLRELSYHLVDVVDLFSEDYDRKKDPMLLEEWIMIKNLFSEFAGDIDEDLLAYVMQLAVEKGAFK